MTFTDADTDLATAVDALEARGIQRVHVLAWRDVDDPDAGGSEVHADEIARRWAEHGLDVVQRTSSVSGAPAEVNRNGYRSIRRGGRYGVFPRGVASALLGRSGHFDALVEVWNGVPWWSPIWCRRPSITVVHHVHRDMWHQVLPAPAAAIGRVMETRLAPRAYRRGLTVTPSDATRDDLIGLGFDPNRVAVVPNGVDSFFRPGGQRSPDPSVVAVGRLAPVKRFDELVEQVARARRRVPGLTLTIVGDGSERSTIERRVAQLHADDWVTLTGRLDRADIAEHYRRAWLVVSASLAEGWGLTITEAAACGTAAVATDIAGHRSSVVDGHTGVLAPLEGLGDAIADTLIDPARRERLATAALERAGAFTWDVTAAGVAEALLAAASATR